MENILPYLDVKATTLLESGQPYQGKPRVYQVNEDCNSASIIDLKTNNVLNSRPVHCKAQFLSSSSSFRKPCNKLQISYNQLNTEPTDNTSDETLGAP